MRVGFIGLGSMGAGMAANILKAGHDLTVYNRSAGKADPLTAAGATVAARPADACQGEAVITMLADDHAAESIALGEGGICDSLPHGSLHISCSTIGVVLSRHLAKAHADRGQRYIAAPVFGRPDAAAAGKLAVIVAGAEDAIAAAKPLLDAIGQHSFVMSSQPEAANLVKLSGNFLIASVIESLGEAVALISKGGVDPQAYLAMLTSTLFNAPVYKTYGKLITDQEPGPVGFAAPLGLKDMRLALAAGDELRVPLPVASLLRDRFLTLLAQGGEDLDWSSIGRLAQRDAGLSM
jgi:3-hydroxyisobutyrate dehydrogenase-like beta-hydroxyacid dehydrogenase